MIWQFRCYVMAYRCLNCKFDAYTACTKKPYSSFGEMLLWFSSKCKSLQRRKNLESWLRFDEVTGVSWTGFFL